MNFYYTDMTGNVAGPVSREQLQKHMDNGLLGPNSQVCYEGSEDWKALSTFIRPTPKQKPETASKSAIPTSASPAGTGSQPAKKRVEAHLSFIRANSCYGVLRSIIEISFVLSLIAVFGSTIVSTIGGLTSEYKVSSILVLFFGVLAAFVVVAIRQSALLLIDIADTLLHEHSNNRDA